ncbi:MAG: threonine--tRNA ligase [Nanoarchaeota archaeon]
MKIISLHCDYITFKPLKKALKQPEELSEERKKEIRVDECLVILTAVEKSDTLNLVNDLVKNIEDISKQVKTNSIVLYPYAHLSSNLGNPDLAMNILEKAETELKKLKYKVTRAPFGYYKEFELKVKGHPLSELSREISEREIGKEIRQEKENVISLDARMETSCHLIYETARKILNSKFISISEVKDNNAILNWKSFKNEIDNDFLRLLESEANKNRESNLPVTIESLDREKALKKCGEFYENVVPKKFKEVKVVTIGNLPPEPCIKPHVKNTKEIDGKIIIKGFEKINEESYKINISLIPNFILKEEVYDYKQLLREISKSKLDTSKLKENDHRILGQKLDLFSFSEVAPGMVFWHNNGLVIKNELINYWREEHMKAGYQEISTPQIIDSKLWKVSGHWEKYRENIFLTKYEGREFVVKPMNCPGGMLVYKSSPKSYKDLPLKVGELGIVHRQELSGVLAGLFRVIQFTQDDAHIFCTEEQLESEIVKIIDLIDLFYKKFNIKIDHVELSTRPEKRIGSEEIWNKSEEALENVLKKRKVKYKINKGDGAFYGPKIDFHVKDSLNRTWQLATIQLDMALPERFDLSYTDKDNSNKRPVMLHRVIYGAIDRFIGILLEHTNGALPTWLSPIQVRVINFTDRNNKYAEKIIEKLKESGLRTDYDLSSVPLGGKIRDASLAKVPFIITVGDNEEKNKTLAIRTRDGKVKYNVEIEDFIEEIKKLIKERI